MGVGVSIQVVGNVRAGSASKVHEAVASHMKTHDDYEARAKAAVASTRKRQLIDSDPLRQILEFLDADGESNVVEMDGKAIRKWATRQLEIRKKRTRAKNKRRKRAKKQRRQEQQH